MKDTLCLSPTPEMRLGHASVTLGWAGGCGKVAATVEVEDWGKTERDHPRRDSL